MFREGNGLVKFCRALIKKSNGGEGEREKKERAFDTYVIIFAENAWKFLCKRFLWE